MKRVFLVSVLAAMVGLLLAGCSQESKLKAPPPPLTAVQALDLANRWLLGHSPNANVEVLSVKADGNSDSATARLKVVNVRSQGSGISRAVPYSGIAEAQFSWYLNRKWSMTKFTIDPEGPTAQTWDGLLITEDYVALQAAERSEVATISTNEASAIANIRTLVSAELTHSSRNQETCGTVQELVDEGLIDRQFLPQTVAGYRISVKVEGGECAVLAVPATFGVTGNKSFYATPKDGLIRFSDNQSIPTRNHPVFQ